MANWRDRFTAFGIHFAISLCIAALAAVLVFFIWYPYPYREISGGRELFLILVVVDVVLGPLLTFSIFKRSKSRLALTFDFTVIGLTQLAALGYGLWTVSVARPVHLVFEYDRFRIVNTLEVPPDLLSKTPQGIEALPLTGPTILSVRPVTDEEQDRVLTYELTGQYISARPDFWQPYEVEKVNVLLKAKPVSALKARFPAQTEMINQGIHATGRPIERLSYLPLHGRAIWTAFIDPETAQVLTAIPLDPY